MSTEKDEWLKNGYFGRVAKAIQMEYNRDGMGSASLLGIGLAIFTILPVIPALHHYEKNQDDKKVTYNQELNVLHQRKAIFNLSFWMQAEFPWSYELGT